MADPVHVDLLRQGYLVWNEWRRQNPSVCPNLLGADLEKADLRWTELYGAFLKEADLRMADLGGADLWKADLRSARLDYANLRGADLVGADLKSAHLSRAFLTEADLTRAALAFTDLEEAGLDHADLQQATLTMARLSRAILTGATLREADLYASDLGRADLSEADFAGADLSWANMSWANLDGARFEGATMFHTTLAFMDLGAANGLDSVRHAGPSAVDVESLLVSSGRVPDVFLRGAGVPEGLISVVRALANEAPNCLPCYVVYCAEDEEFAGQLCLDLCSRGVRCWAAPVGPGLPMGRSRSASEEAFHQQDRICLVLSRGFLANDRACRVARFALGRESFTSGTSVLLVYVDDIALETYKLWVTDLWVSHRFFDFIGWVRPKSYKRSLNRLVRALRTVGT